MSPRNDASLERTEESPLFKDLRGRNMNLNDSDSSQYYASYPENDSNISLMYSESSYYEEPQTQLCSKFKVILSMLIASLVALLMYSSHVTLLDGSGTLPSNSKMSDNATLEKMDGNTTSASNSTGPYKLLQRQEGDSFLDYYRFYEGADSLGSAGYNTYVSKEEGKKLGIIGVKKDPETNEELVFMKSSPTLEGPRSSIRIEGKTSFDKGLFILDLRHMPNGDGVWPAFWLTNEGNWPYDGEIDIVEGINNQTVVKTALHTSKDCNMYSHVPGYAKTGTWEWSTGLPDTYTGIPDFKTVKEADNCWEWAPHQWFNQGCVAVSSENGTIGKPVNENGGGIYALEWDPASKYIRSWVFTPHEGAPKNIKDAIKTSGETNEKDRIKPDTSTWGLPYAYFAIGEGTGCSADHFKNIHVVFNLAFCGTVAGNRFFKDCSTQATLFNVSNDPIKTCEAYIKSEPDAISEAYWMIKGLYIYERD